MRKFFTLLLFNFAVIHFHAAFAQAPAWLWAHSGGNTSGTGWDVSNATATDVNGNLYITGYFQSDTIYFGSYKLPDVNAYPQYGSPGSDDIFIVKYDASGNVLWATSTGGSNDQVSYAIATDKENNVYITGYFRSATITFGSTVLTNAGINNIFIAKYDANGNALWAKSAGGSFLDEGYGVATDAAGDVYITGSFSSDTIAFDSTTLVNAGGYVNGGYDIFIAKYNTNGSLLWAKSAGGTNSDYSNAISTDASGNAYITGNFFSYAITFGSTTLINVDTSFYDSDIFIAKYDANGNVLWAKSSVATSTDTGRGTSIDNSFSVAADTNGDVYITGYFESSFIVFNSVTLTNGGLDNIFITKYNASGNVLWAKSYGGSASDVAYGIAADANGFIYVTGYFQSPTINFGSTTLTNAGEGDIFIVKCDTVGNALWAKGVDGQGNEIGYGVATSAGGNVYITGYFSVNASYTNTLDFGSIVLTNSDTFGSPDVYVAKLNSVDGITELYENIGSLTVFPNPVTNQLNLNTSSIHTNESIMIKVINVLGEETSPPIPLPHNAAGQAQRGEIVTIDVSNLASGIYFVEAVSDDGGEWVGKFVKK